VPQGGHRRRPTRAGFGVEGGDDMGAENAWPLVN